MRVLSVDPGKTMGLVMFEVVNQGEAPYLLDSRQLEVPMIQHLSRVNWFLFGHSFLKLLEKMPSAVTVEDYRVFKDKAAEHIGQYLLTAQLIGAINVLCATVVPRIEAVEIPPSAKGRWPDARLKAKYPDYVEAKKVGPHALDALKIGLAYLEESGLWDLK